MQQIMQPVWLDLDWFGIDGSNEFAHFASAGGYVSEVVLNNIDYAGQMSKAILALPEISDAILNPNLKYIVGERDLSTFLLFSKRGFYSYDRTFPHILENHNYHLISRPSKLINPKSLPAELINYIGKTRFKVSFNSQNVIDASVVINP